MISYTCFTCRSKLRTDDQMGMHYQACPVCGTNNLVPRAVGRQQFGVAAATLAAPLVAEVVEQGNVQSAGAMREHLRLSRGMRPLGALMRLLESILRR
jgi:DNA-directed RNA polymerase subunit RPC12/RpoP